MLSLRLAATLCVALVPSLIVAQDADAQADQEKMQGVWYATCWTDDGVGIPGPRLRTITVTIRGNRIVVQEAHRYFGEEMQFKLDPSKDPNWIDFLCPVERRGVRPMLGIYLLEGDVLRLCWQRGTGLRPEAFFSKTDSGQVLLVLKKAQPQP